MSASPVHPATLARLAGALERGYGLRRTESLEAALAQAVRRRIEERGGDVAAYVEAAESPGDPEHARLLDSVTNNTTFFFREAEIIDLLREHVLGQAAAPPYAIWCGGCASGEEVYTIAISAREACADVELLGTDINGEVLARARGGRYRLRRLRGVDAAREARWFVRGDDTLELVDRVREVPTFRRHNLIEPAPLPARGAAAWDAIFCRNVLLYLEPAAVRRALEHLVAALAPGGLLVLGASESQPRALLEALSLELLPLGRTVVYRKAGAHARHAPLEAIAAGWGFGPPCAAPRAPPSRDPGPPPLPEPTPAPPPEPRHEALLRGDLAFAKGELPVALAAYEAALLDEPLSAELHLRTGVCRLHLGEPARGRAELRRALFLDPGCYPAALLLASVAGEAEVGVAERYLALAEEALARPAPPAWRLLLGVDPLTAHASARARLRRPARR